MADDATLYARYSDDTVSAWAADAQMRLRAWQVYGPATEAPDEEDRRVMVEWKRRCEEAKNRGR